MARYASSDWHGQIALAKQVMDFLKPDDELYFLGDAADRGPAGYEIIKMLLSDKRVTYLKGNHEDMLTECVSEFLEGHMDNQSWWCWQNGGQNTWNAIEQLPERDVISLVHILNQLPERVDLVNAKGQSLILTHAGTDPDKDKKYWEMMGVHDPYLWNRKHIYHSWTGDDNTFVIHGHTFFGYILDKNCDWYNYHKIINIPFYCNGHKISIDCASFCTNTTILLNLDTFKQHFFYT